MGGMIAQELALRHPERVERLVLASTHGGGVQGLRPDRAMAAAWQRVLLKPWGLQRRLAYLLFSRDASSLDPAFWAEFLSKVQAAPISEWSSLKQFVAIARHRSHERIASIRAPTLIIAGEGDLMISPANARWLASRIAGARLEMFPRAGHALLHEEAPRIDQLLREFLPIG
jgi:pimeloyl-ACP methyl ester carboxylesterase